LIKTSIYLTFLERRAGKPNIVGCIKKIAEILVREELFVNELIACGSNG